MTYPISSESVIQNRSQAMRYLKSYKRHLQKRAQKLLEEIAALELEQRLPLLFLMEALASNYGHFWAKFINRDSNGVGRGLVIHHLDIDDDLHEAFEAQFGAEAMEGASKWIMRRLRGETAVFVGWALGSIRFEEAKNLLILEDRLLFNITERKFDSVLSHTKWKAPTCIHYHVDGGKTVGGRRRKN